MSATVETWEVFYDARIEGGQSKPERSSEQKGADEEDAGHLERGMEDEFSRGCCGSCSVGYLIMCMQRCPVSAVDGVERVHRIVAVVHDIVGKIAISGIWAT